MRRSLMNSDCSHFKHLRLAVEVPRPSCVANRDGGHCRAALTASTLPFPGSVIWDGRWRGWGRGCSPHEEPRYRPDFETMGVYRLTAAYMGLSITANIQQSILHVHKGHWAWIVYRIRTSSSGEGSQNKMIHNVKTFSTVFPCCVIVGPVITTTLLTQRLHHVPKNEQHHCTSPLFITQNVVTNLPHVVILDSLSLLRHSSVGY